MLSPVSNVSSRVRFGEAAQANPLERQGAYAKPAEQTAAPAQETAAKKSGGKKVLAAVGGLALIAAGLVGLYKFGAVKVLESTEGAKLMQKVGHYVAKAGEFISKYTYDPVAKLCTKIFKGGKAAS